MIILILLNQIWRKGRDVSNTVGVAGDELAYTVKVLPGDMPSKAADVSVFIDIIGRPLTPFSCADVARRAYRRSFYWR